MNLPSWVVFLVAAWVIVFGGYRIVIGIRSPKDDEAAQQRKGMFGMSRRTHLLVGIIYLVLGTFLILSALGYRPFTIGG
jgi:hypothetical protein